MEFQISTIRQFSHCQGNAPYSRRPARDAFTIVELLVVIGIIAMLIGILVPVIGGAREHAKTATCMSNLQQIARACIQYSADNNDDVIPTGWMKTPNQWQKSPPYPTNPMPDAQCFYCNEFWCNILVNQHYLSAPDGWNKAGGIEKPPQIQGVFHCPSGSEELIDNTLIYNKKTVPNSRTDARGAQCLRAYSFSAGTSVDSWYGINGDNGSNASVGGFGGVSVDTGCPSRQQPVVDAVANTVAVSQQSLSSINRPAEMVFFYDGIASNLGTNANRLNARHNGGTRTNLAFFDGHVATYDTAKLPGGMFGADEFHYTILKKFYQPPNPIWLLEQLRD